MKNAFTLKTSWCFIFLFLSVFLFGQKRYSLNVQFKQGIIGLEEEGEKAVQGNISDSKISVNPGSEFSIGINNGFSFSNNKFLSISAGVLWNYNSFTRKRITLFQSAQGISEYYKTYKFKNHAIIFPVRLNVRFKKLGVSMGLVPRFPFSTKMIYEEVSGNINFPFSAYLFTKTYQDGDYTHSDRGRIFLDKKVDLIQYLFGVHLFLNDRLSIEFEYKRLIGSNYLNREYVFLNGPYYELSEKFDPNLNSISVGLNWRIF